MDQSQPRQPDGSHSVKRSTNLRMSEDGRWMLDTLANKLGVSRTAVMEMAVRKMAEQEGVAVVAA